MKLIKRMKDELDEVIGDTPIASWEAHRLWDKWIVRQSDDSQNNNLVHRTDRTNRKEDEMCCRGRYGHHRHQILLPPFGMLNESFRTP
jgi:hypothetical protein